MLQNPLFIALLLCILGLGCDSRTPSRPPNKTDLAQNPEGAVQNMGSVSILPCEAVLKDKDTNDLQKIYWDTMLFNTNALLFVTRDSTLFVYQQADKNCSLLLKQPIDSTDLYTYRDGSPLLLKDMDGDNQKEVLVTVGINGGHSKFRVYKLIFKHNHIGLNKIAKFEKLINPEFDLTTGMVRSHWYDRNDYELDEYYQISKDNALIFVKGFESKKGKEQRYLTKKNW
jgi:hypothetical protein